MVQPIPVLGRPTDFRERLLAWYHTHRRDLPWRTGREAPDGSMPDPYLVLVSEAMLQQTQVATVIPYFHRFIERLPTLTDLASADEQTVLRLWQGLGYYSRARNLQKAARAVLGQFGGRLPRTVEELLLLPGVGRYTAGAIASLAYDTRAPILDGNVARVLCRIDRVEQDPRQPAVRDLLWARAEALLPRRGAGDFNSALMELGATVCTPRSPTCMFCPVRRHCEAFEAGVQERIPPPRAAKARPVERRWTFCVRRAGSEQQDEYLIERRPATGRWPGMWQFVTAPAGAGAPTVSLLRSLYAVRTTEPRLVGTVSHGLTHRQYEFEVFLCEIKSTGSADKTASPDVSSPRRWASLRGLSDYPLPRPHVRIATILAETAHNDRNRFPHPAILPRARVNRISTSEAIDTTRGRAKEAASEVEP